MFESISLRDEALSAPTPELFAAVRRHFEGPIENPAWVPAGHRR